jgi:hypothetical protein
MSTTNLVDYSKYTTPPERKTKEENSVNIEEKTKKDNPKLYSPPRVVKYKEFKKGDKVRLKPPIHKKTPKTQSMMYRYLKTKYGATYANKNYLTNKETFLNG